jgi:hypothetical protein
MISDQREPFDATKLATAGIRLSRVKNTSVAVQQHEASAPLPSPATDFVWSRNTLRFVRPLRRE